MKAASTQRANTPTWERWFAEAAVDPGVPGGTPLFSDESHAIQAAIAGQGVALLSRLLIADELANGSLVCPFGPALKGASYRLVYREERLRDERVAKVRRWLLSEARRQRIAYARG